MSRQLIDRDELISTLKKHRTFYVSAWGSFSELPEKEKARVDEITVCIAELINAPTIDAVEVVHGKWETPCGFYEEENVFTCSACEFALQLMVGDPEENEYKFCPKCGAKMDKDA